MKMGKKAGSNTPEMVVHLNQEPIFKKITEGKNGLETILHEISKAANVNSTSHKSKHCV
jgi:hypothetical protein